MNEKIIPCENRQIPICKDHINYTLSEIYLHFRDCNFCRKITDKFLKR